MVLKYLKIKQDFLSKKLVSLADEVASFESKMLENADRVFSVNQNKNKLIAENHTYLTLKLQKIKTQLRALYEEVDLQDRFWNLYISLYFLVYDVEICYQAFVFLFGKSSDSAPNYYIARLNCAVMSVNFFAILLSITYQCSGVVKRNGAMSRQSQVLGRKLTMLLISSTNGKEAVPQNNANIRYIRELLKSDLDADNYKNIGGICFRLLNDWRINSSMFEMVSVKNFFSKYFLI